MGAGIDIRDALDALALTMPDQVRSRLETGMRVSTNLHRGALAYEIDDAEIDRALEQYDSDKGFYLAIAKALRPLTMSNLPRVFPPGDRDADGVIVAPFSRAVHEALGDCLEKAMLVQLRKQREAPTFCITGLLGQERMRGMNPHAYNILFEAGAPFLLDAQNTVIVRSGGERVEVPYLVPVSALDEGTFVIEEPWRLGRTYMLKPAKQAQPPRLFGLF